jgi:hypothetical protein
MSEKRDSFVELCLQGHVMPDEIDDFVDAWHDAPGEEQLYEFLGMKKAEYTLWIRDPDALNYIIKARHDRIPLEEVINDNYEELRIAARAENDQKIKRLRKWLDEQGKLD